MGNLKLNRVSGTLTTSDMTAVRNLIKQVETVLSFMVGLTPQERKKFLKIHRGNRLFVKDAILAAEKLPDILPPMFQLAEVKKDFNLNEQLTEIELLLESLLLKVRDTKTVTGNESMVAALGFYRMLALAVDAGVEGALAAYEKLAERFSQSGSPVETEPGTESEGPEDTPAA